MVWISDLFRISYFEFRASRCALPGFVQLHLAKAGRGTEKPSGVSRREWSAPQA